ncbi:hypothetical protein FQR65_LT17102 [Abscondita terminalis]|nr:hypothetical protein FQR65_LT17102 [Abscondita terminalis]
MPIYNAPLADMKFILNDVFNAEQFWQANEKLAHVDAATAEAILEEMAKFAQNVTLPLNRTGDEEGAHYENGKVTTPAGFLKKLSNNTLKVVGSRLAAEARMGRYDLGIHQTKAETQMEDGFAYNITCTKIFITAKTPNAPEDFHVAFRCRLSLPKFMSMPTVHWR